MSIFLFISASKCLLKLIQYVLLKIDNLNQSEHFLNQTLENTLYELLNLNNSLLDKIEKFYSEPEIQSKKNYLKMKNLQDKLNIENLKDSIGELKTKFSDFITSMQNQIEPEKMAKLKDSLSSTLPAGFLSAGGVAINNADQISATFTNPEVQTVFKDFINFANISPAQSSPQNIDQVSATFTNPEVQEIFKDFINFGSTSTVSQNNFMNAVNLETGAEAGAEIASEAGSEVAAEVAEHTASFLNEHAKDLLDILVKFIGG